MRTIDEFYDAKQKRLRSAEQYFTRGTAEIIAEGRIGNEELQLSATGRFFCCECGTPIYPKLAESGFFSHYPEDRYPESIGCRLRTNQSYTRPSLIYSGEGELHLFWKETIAYYLSLDPDVEDLKQEKDCIQIDESGQKRRRRPDISFEYGGEKFVLEVQNSWLSPQDIVERQDFYQRKDCILIWLVTEKLSQTTKYDLQAASAVNVFYSQLNREILAEWEDKSQFVLYSEYNTYTNYNFDLRKVSEEQNRVSSALEDCIDASQYELPGFCLASVKEERFVSLCRAVAPLCKSERRGIENHAGDALMKQLLGSHTQLHIDSSEPSGVSVQKLVRFMASIIIGEVLFASAQTKEDFWEHRLSSAKWQRYLPVFCATAIAYNQSFFSVSERLLQYCFDLDDSKETDFTQCLGNKKSEVMSYFPKLLKCSENFSLQELREYYS